MSPKPPTNTLHELQSEKSTQSSTLLHTAFSGPIPPPEVLAKYEMIQPDLVDRIVRMAESETKHRQTIEKNRLNADIKITTRTQTEIIIGQFFAFLICLCAITCGTYLILQGHTITGTIIGASGPGLLGIVNAFIKGSKKDD